VLRTIVLVLITAAVSGCMKAPRMPKMPKLVLNDPADREIDSPAWREHVQLCAAKHPGYDPLTNMYPDSRGRMTLC
jgi:hypothetical protein